MTLIDRKGQTGPRHPTPDTAIHEDEQEQPPPYAGTLFSSTNNNMGQSEEPHPHEETTPLLASQRVDVENQHHSSSLSSRKFTSRVRRQFHWVASGVIFVLIIFLLAGAFWSGDSDRSDDGGNDGDGGHGDAKKPNPIDYPGPKPIGTPTWSPVQRHADWSEQYESHTSLTLDPNTAFLFVENLGHRHDGRIDVLLQEDRTGFPARQSEQQIVVNVEARATKEWILKKALSVAKRKEGSQEGVGIYVSCRMAP